MVNMAMKVNKPADTRPMESPKLSNPTPSEPRMTVKLSHERKVLSLAKNTLGSTRAGKAIRLVWLDISWKISVEYSSTWVYVTFCTDAARYQFSRGTWGTFDAECIIFTRHLRSGKITDSWYCRKNT